MNEIDLRSGEGAMKTPAQRSAVPTPAEMLSDLLGKGQPTQQENCVVPPYNSMARPKQRVVWLCSPCLKEDAAEVGEAQRGARGVTQPLRGRAQARSKG